MKVIILSAIWCPACLIVKSTIHKIQKDHPMFQPQFIDIDEEEALASQYEPLKVLPVFMILDEEGQVIKRMSGELNKDTILKEFVHV
ncbi:MAG: thioredoxin family protein [Erysipelotrichia bacterium]|jgi:thiol-disulfide isomerase/thioredoxin|nr:thioredoxin family protein [Erysipelotrichia bacterium]